ncbi:MAG: ATP-binding cassette domain-containing protein [Luteitalea sp.]|nr:ATP-binding cassette domain-containing protein [Luteitalea sp.]
MIQLQSLTKAFGDRVLLDNVTWQLGARDRVALCGPNGAGKTTLFRMLAGLEEADQGTIVKPAALTIGYLPQDGVVHAGRTLAEEVRLAFAPLVAMQLEMAALEERLGDATIPEAEHDAMLLRYSDLQDGFRAQDGYTIDLRIATVAQGLGFTPDDMQRPVETFSGGWQMRIALAKLLLGRPNLLLLDEPTNHLDLEARNWLEEYLVDYPHAVLLVSHDRYFLDAVATRIADLTLRTLTDYRGNYSEYLEEHQARMARLRTLKREQDEEVARIKLFIDRFRYKATKAAQVQSRVKLLDKIVPIEVPPERKRVHFTFPQCAKSGRAVIELGGASKTYGDICVFRHLDLLVERGDRIALVGPNGAGKSTLMRLLAGVEAPDTGSRAEGHQVVMQYFAQDEAARLDPPLTVYETLAAGSPMHMVPMIRNILGGFLFSGDDVNKKASVLSGGERTRLAVARLLLRPANALLLDEPTNHLDLDSKDVLLDALEDFGGTLVLVSHDRYFIDRLATKIVEIGHGQAVVYPGTYEEFRWSKTHQELATRIQASGNGKPGSRDRQQPSPGVPTLRSGTSASKSRSRQPEQSDQVLSRDERKRAEAEARRQRRARDAQRARVATLETRITEREQAIRDLEAQMAEPGFYQTPDASRPVIEQHQALMWEVGKLLQEWEELSNE